VNVALGVSGCIAAYKAIEVMRGLQKAGVGVTVVLTRAAEKFVTPLTFESLSGRDVIRGMFGAGRNREIEHIRVAQEIRLLAVVPATANVLGKFAHGIADDFLSTLYLATPAPVLLAPAMNVEMWNHAAVRANLETLKQRGHEILSPEPGMLACGMEGEGRLASVDAIVASMLDIVVAEPRDLAGLKLLVTAGPTIEDIDPVRFISNRSSGKMGYAVAEAAARRGGEVWLVTGPTQLDPPRGVTVVAVRSAAEMKAAVERLFPNVDVVVKAAAVADYRPAAYSAGKVKKQGKPAPLELAPTDDILAGLGAAKGPQVLVGFAAETSDTIGNARSKMERKNLDVVVANDVSAGVFGEDSASVHILSRFQEPATLPLQSKQAIARRILDAALEAVRQRRRVAVR
jgi:phosphopantothenoylcysteine decarboxylase/phosphopantothenate--cysteine ligase